MRLVGNILWHFPFFGFLTAFAVFLLGLLLTMLVVTAPIGLGLLQYAKFLLLPYSYAMVSKSELNVEQNPIWKAYSFIIMLLYLPLGIILAICTFIQSLCLCITIIGIPVAIPLLKSLGVLLNPVGKICIPQDVSNAMQFQKAQENLQRYSR